MARLNHRERRLRRCAGELQCSSRLQRGIGLVSLQLPKQDLTSRGVIHFVEPIPGAFDITAARAIGGPQEKSRTFEGSHATGVAACRVRIALVRRSKLDLKPKPDGITISGHAGSKSGTDRSRFMQRRVV